MSANVKTGAEMISRDRIFYLVALGFLVMFLSSSIKSLYQIYFIDLAAYFHKGRAEFAWSGSLFMLVTGLISPLVGTLSDRFGPLYTVVAGAVVAGLALMGASLLSHSLLLFDLAYGIFGAFGLAAMTYVPMGVLVDRLFENRKTGFAYAAVTNGTSIGFIVLSPFWLWLQPQLDWTRTFFYVGLILAVPVAGLVWLSSRSADAVNVAPTRPAHVRTSAWEKMRKDYGFYALTVGFFGCGATMAFIDVHLVAFWQGTGASRDQMGFGLSLLGLLELCSGLATGWLAMRYEKHGLLAFFYLLRSLAMLLLLVHLSAVRTILFAVVFGSSYLGTVILTSMYCLERYGREIKGQAFGILFLAHQLGAFLSVQLGAASFDRFGSYRWLILVLFALTVVGAAASWLGLRHAPLLKREKTSS